MPRKPKSSTNKSTIIESEDSKLFANLNTEQKSAVKFGAGPLLIVAGAGTGKTTVITRRLAYLISKGVKPEEILALTFTDKASSEMEERVDILLPYGYYDLWISTFHSFCERVLKQHALDIGLPTDFKLYEPIKQKILVRRSLNLFELDYYKPLGNPNRFVSDIVDHFAKLKEEEITPEDYLAYAQKLTVDSGDPESAQETARIKEIAKAYGVYQQLLLDNNALDFGDLINYTLKLFRTRPKILAYYQNKFKYILIDEFQDTNLAQYEMIKLLAAPINNLTVVGDDDQSIYKFRGASISNILQFKNDYPKAKQITLTQNYRSAQNILDTSYNFIQSNNPERLEVKLKIDKRLKADSAEKGMIEVLSGQSAADEVEMVLKKIVELKKKKNTTWNDFAILLRANSQADAFVSKLSLTGIPYTYFANRGLYKKPIVLDVISYMQVLLDHKDDLALYKILNLQVFRLDNADMVALTHYRHLNALNLFEALNKVDQIPDLSAEANKKIKLLTTLLEQHGKLLADYNASEMAIEIIRDSGIWKEVEQDSYENLEKRDLLDQFYKKIEKFEEENTDKSLRNFIEQLEFEQQAGEEGKINFDPNSGPESVKILTIHSAKGLEFTHVFIVNMVHLRFPSVDKRDPIEIPEALIKDILAEGDIHLQEERRLFYVGMTRAKKGLFFSFASDYGGQRAKKPSQFLMDIGLVAKPEKSVEIMRKEKYIEKGYDPNLYLPKSFSYTQITDFRTCPLRYQYAHWLKLPIRKNNYLSFGSSIHKTLEDFMNIYKHNSEAAQLDLFSAKNAAGLPTEKELTDLYEKNWIEEGYPDADTKAEYKKDGYTLLHSFYENFLKEKPNPKYIEHKFRLKLDKYTFNGKIDRADILSDGTLAIIDYKTGKTKEKPDEEQLLIYQWAAEESLKERVSSLRYWYLMENVFSEPFLGDKERIAELKEGLLQTIEGIRYAVAHNTFKELHKKSKEHKCEFRDLE